LNKVRQVVHYKLARREPIPAERSKKMKNYKVIKDGTRVIRKDARGFYATIQGTRCECVPVLDFRRERVTGFIITRR